MMKTSHGVEYAAVWCLTKIAQILPGRIADWIAIALGKLAYLVLTSRRRIASENLRRAFPNEFDDEKIKTIVKKVFINIARTTIEFIRQPVLTREDILSSTISCKGREYLDQVQADGKGAMLVTGHIGNWELLGAWAAANKYPIDFLVGHQHNEKVNDLFISFRRAIGVGIIPVGVAARHVIRALRNNRMIGVVSDQHSATGGVVINFFDRPASTPKGPAAFAVKVGSPLLFGYLLREKYNRYHVEIFPPIYPANSGDAEKDAALLTQQYASLLENAIRQYPEHWMWTHRRWKLD